MTRLVLINGAPGSGKSTLATALADATPMTLALDVDVLKHALGRWEDDPMASGLQARRLSIAVAREHLMAGHDVVIGQYLARTEFIEQLEQLAAHLGVQFFELVLELETDGLKHRLAARAKAPTRREHEKNNELVGPEDADQLVASVGALRESRPSARWIDASGTPEATLELLQTAISVS